MEDNLTSADPLSYTTNNIETQKPTPADLIGDPYSQVLVTLLFELKFG